MPNTHLVFVYGTLKLGFWNNMLLKDATYVGKAETVGFYKMADGGFPVVYDLDGGPQNFSWTDIDDDRVGVVKGEVFEVTDEILESLDSLEGHPDWYCRYERPVCLDYDEDFMGQVVSAWIYIGDNVPRPEETLMTIQDDIYLEWKGHN